MRRWNALAAATAIFCGAAIEARAQETPATLNDLKCAVVGFALAGSDNAEEEQAGMMLALYFYGRLSAVGGGFDVERRIKELADEMEDETFAVESVRCGKLLAEIGASLQRIGEPSDAKP